MENKELLGKIEPEAGHAHIFYFIHAYLAAVPPTTVDIHCLGLGVSRRCLEARTEK